jgi:hypothetical protein
MNKPEIKEFIKEYSYLFWWIKPEEQEHISLNLLTEAILHYGDLHDINRLFELIGIQTVAEIFSRQISGMRTNYPSETVNFFTLYFQKHA